MKKLTNRPEDTLNANRAVANLVYSHLSRFANSILVDTAFKSEAGGRVLGSQAHSELLSLSDNMEYAFADTRDRDKVDALAKKIVESVLSLVTEETK